MFKVNNIDTRAKPYFTPCSSVSIVNFVMPPHNSRGKCSPPQLTMKIYMRKCKSHGKTAGLREVI